MFAAAPNHDFHHPSFRNRLNRWSMKGGITRGDDPSKPHVVFKSNDEYHFQNYGSCACQSPRKPNWILHKLFGAMVVVQRLTGASLASGQRLLEQLWINLTVFLFRIFLKQACFSIILFYFKFFRACRLFFEIEFAGSCTLEGTSFLCLHENWEMV